MTALSDNPGRLALFPPEEFRARAVRAQARMAADGIDALWLTSPANHFYFSGLRTPSFATPARPITVLVPAEGDPVVFVSRSQEGQARAMSWVPDIRTHQGLEPEALGLVLEALRERGLAAGRIGCELGEEQRLGLTHLGFLGMQAALPAARWVDAAPLFWRLRAVKSAAEIARLREIGAILGRAYEAMLAAVRPGASERAVHRQLVLALVAEGAEVPAYAAIHSGAGNYRRIGGPCDRPLAAGDLLWADTGVAKDGYFADYMRLISVGRPADEHRRRYAIVHEALQRMLAAVRPGVPVAELMRVCRRHFAAHGAALGAAARVGHGIGLEVAEPPSIIEGNEAPLEEGMTLAIEPSIAADDGFIGLEENFVVTANGADLLSTRSSAELPWVEA